MKKLLLDYVSWNMYKCRYPRCLLTCMHKYNVVGCRDLHGIADCGNRGKNRGNEEWVLTFTAVAAVMGTAI